MRIGQTSAINFGSQISASIIGFAVTVYLARELGAEVLGVYFLVVAVVIWLKIIGGMGIQSALRKRLSERGENEPYFVAGLIIQAGVFAIIATGLLLAREPLDWYLRGVGIDILIPLLFASISLAFVKAALDGYHLVHISSLISPLDRLLRGVLQVSAVVLGFTVFGLLFGYAVAALLAAGVGLLVLPGGISIPKRRHFKKLLSFAQYSWMSNLSTRAFTSMDTIVLGLFVSSGLIGIYEIAWNLASILAVFGQSISRSLFPELSRLSSDDQFDTVSKRLTDGIRFTGLLLLPGLVGGMLLGDRVLAIYGSEFSRGHLILVILIGARMLYAYSAQFITTLDALDRPEIGFRINGTFVVTNVVLNILLIWQFGWLGAAVATAISAVLAFILSYRWAIRILDPSIPLHSIGKQVIASLVMGFALYPVLLYWSPGIVMTGVLVAGGATIYFGVLATIAPEFRSTVRANLPVN